MRFPKIAKTTAAAVLLLVGLSSALVLAGPPDQPTVAPPAPKGKLPMMPNIPAFQQLQQVKFPTQYTTPDIVTLSKPQILSNTFIRLLAEKHFTLGVYSDQQAFLTKWLPKIKDVKTLADADKLNVEAMESLGQRFDYYMSPEDKSAEEATSDPSMVGIGISIGLRDQALLRDALPEDYKEKDLDDALVISDENPLVVTPYPGSPAAKAGLWDGDIIREIDGVKVQGLKLKEAIEKIRGAAGSKVKFGIERKESMLENAARAAKVLAPNVFGAPSAFEVPKSAVDGTTVTKTVEVERERFVPPVVHVRELEDGSTLIKLDNFMASNAAVEMLKALREVAAKSNGKIILDLRNNGGGRLDHAINIVQYMLGEGTIVRLRQREGGQMINIHYTATRDALITTQQAPWNPASINYSAAQRVVGVPETVPIVVLINEWTASASELTSGALQFHGRAKIVGKNSIGKGVGQQVIDLPEDRRTHITTFYFDPAARIIDFEGVHPDKERLLDPEIKQLKTLQAKLRGFLKDDQTDTARGSAIIGKLAQDEAELTKVNTDLTTATADVTKAKDALSKATTDAEKTEATKTVESATARVTELTKRQGDLTADKADQTKEQEALAKAAGERVESLKGVRKELKDLHDMLQNNDPQVQEAKKVMETEVARILNEEKAKKELREKTVEDKRKKWDEQRKLREEMRQKQQSSKKAAA